MRISSLARVRARYSSSIIFVSLGVLFLAFVMMSSVRIFKDAPFRQAFVVTTDPMRIITWDKKRTAVQIVSVPSDILIDGALGYGQYALSALWTLDTLDRHNGILLSNSVAQALGIPITDVIFTDMPNSEFPVLDSMKKLFSWSSIARRLFGRVGTTISVSDWVHIVFIVHTLRTDDMEVLDLSMATADVLRPDGTVVRVLDPQKVDYILGNSLHDQALRNENKTVTIINTTSVIGIGSSLARIINRFGIQVVSVTTESEIIDTCQIQTDKKTRESLTFQFLKMYLLCEEKISDDISGQSDITLRIGSAFASAYSDPSSARSSEF